MRTLLLRLVLSLSLAVPLASAPAWADVPQQVIEEIANLREQQAELSHLVAIGKMTNHDAAEKRRTIENQINAVWQPYRKAPAQDQSVARIAIERLVADKLTLARPQWLQEEKRFRANQDSENKVLRAAIEDDARKAAELQRQRAALQKQLTAGTMKQEEFATKDKQAADAIAAIRAKYEAEGPQWSHLFDGRYRAMVEIALRNPDLPLPQTTVSAPMPGQPQSPPDFDADVKQAADLAVKRQENQFKLEKKQITPSAMAQADMTINQDLTRLRQRYDALEPKRGAEFERAYMEVAAKRIQELRARYYPPPPAPQLPPPHQQVAQASNPGMQPLPANSTVPAASGDGDWIRHAPTAAQVLAAIKGSDAIDTAARQQATFGILQNAARNWMGIVDSRKMPPQAAALLDDYTNAIAQLRANVAKLDTSGCSRANCASAQVNRKGLDYRVDLDFMRETLSRWFPANLVDAELAKHQRPPQKSFLQSVIVGDILMPVASFFAQAVLWLFEMAEWALILAGVAFVAWWIATAKAREWKQRRKRAGWSNDKAMPVFGGTIQERTQSIDKAFDVRNQTLELFEAGPKTSASRFVNQFRLPLASLAPKEREALRTAYHLYNLKMLNDWNFYLARAAIVMGSKKAVKNGDYDGLKSESYGHVGLDVGISVVLDCLASNLKKNPDIPVLKKLSAQLYGDAGDLVPGAPLKSGADGTPVEDGLVLGLDESTSDKWWYDGEGSLITVAPPGSGKTQSQVFPNLLTWKGAAVILDVKGEIYEQTSKWRRENVGPVYKFSPLDPASSRSYNPLALVRSDPDYLWEDSRFLADMMIVPTGAKDPFWENRARDVLTAAIARTCLEDDPANRPMADVLDVLHGVGWDKFVAYLKARIDIRSMSRAGHSLAGMEPKTRDGVLQSALSSMSAWDSERIARVMKKSDWSPLDLRGERHPTIYICLKPNEVDSYTSVLRVFIAQHIRALTSNLPPHGAHPILFVLDELPRLHHMPPVEEALEVGRQYGIKLWLFAQSLGQLKTAYPNADGMIGSCAIRMFMNPSLHDETAKKLSDDIGFRESVVDGTRVKVVEPNVLAGPDYKDLVIVMASNARAARLKKYFVYEDPNLMARMGS